MPAQTNTQTVALQLEKVRRALPLMYERDDMLLTLIKQRGDVERVSSRAMRVPLQMRPGGKFQQRTMEGDDLGRGSGTDYQVATLTPIFFVWAVEIQKLVEYATNAPEKSIEDATKREVKNAMAQFRNQLDKVLQTGGDGVLGTVLSTANPLVTLDTPHFADLLYFNQDVQVFNSTLATDRGSTEITKIDGAVITVSPFVAGTVATDKIVLEGVGTTPTSLFGIKYHQSDAATGTWLNLNRATFPEIRTPRVNAGSAALTTGPIRLALNKIRLALGDNILRSKRLIAHMNVQQEHAYENLGITISEIMKESSAGQGMDLFFNGNKSMAGVPIKTNIHADRTRIDYLCLDMWGRAVMQEIDYYEVNGNTVFPIYGASGGLASAYLFYFVVGFQVFVDNPRAGAYISDLATPTGY